MGKQDRVSADVELDLGRYELRRGGRRIHLERKPMELLIHLARHREQLVSREALIAKLWRSDLFIDAERNLNNVVRKVRTALADDPAKPRFLETVVGKGYRLVGPLRVSGTYDSSAQSEFMRNAGDRNLASGHASLAVLPLVLTGKATDDAGLCLGFAEALISLLGNIEGLDVLPASAVLNLPRDMQPAVSASRLNVRFIVRGAIQKLKDQWHLSLELFDGNLPGTRWTRRCACEINHLPELQESLAREIAGALNRRLAPSRSEPKPRHSRDAFANAEFMRGFELSASRDAKAIEEAIQRLTNAVSRDPGFALAHATLSFVCATRHFESDPARVWLEKAEFHCERALELRPDLPARFPSVPPLGTFQEFSACRRDCCPQARSRTAEQSSPGLQPAGNDPGAYRIAGPGRGDVSEGICIPSPQANQPKYLPGVLVAWGVRPGSRTTGRVVQREPVK